MLFSHLYFPRHDGSEYLAALSMGDTQGNGGDPGASPLNPDPALIYQHILLFSSTLDRLNSQPSRAGK